VVADAGYGISAAFRSGLTRRGLIWAVGIPKIQNVYSTQVELHWPKASTGRPRKHLVASEGAVPAEQALQSADWHRISWRRGTKGLLMAEFAAVRVRPADGQQVRQGRHLPGNEVWLVGGHRSSLRTQLLPHQPPRRGDA
jgi:SRSO17 transposase